MPNKKLVDHILFRAIDGMRKLDTDDSHEIADELEDLICDTLTAMLTMTRPNRLNR